MRRSGSLDTVAGLQPGDHVCWGYVDPDDFRAQVVVFLAEGLSAGERVIYLGRDDVKQLRDDMAAVPGIGTALETGAATIAPADSVYHGGGSVDPLRQVAVFADAVDSALADGFTGLRVAADITGYLADARDHDAFSRYEILADRLIASRALTGMCGFDRRAVDGRTAADLAAVHPLTRPSTTPFRWHASHDPAVSAVLTGEIDVTTRDTFVHVLQRTDLPVIDGAITIDGRRLSFIDHRALYALAATRPDPAVTMTIEVGEHSVVPTLVRLLGIAGLEVQRI